MDKIKSTDFVCFVLFIAMTIFGYNLFTHIQDDKERMSDLELRIQHLSNQQIILDIKMDTLKGNDRIFAKSILYLDSCNQVKTTKMDRAEKRGRFLGGLIKGLFPGM